MVKVYFDQAGQMYTVKHTDTIQHVFHLDQKKIKEDLPRRVTPDRHMHYKLTFLFTFYEKVNTSPPNLVIKEKNMVDFTTITAQHAVFLHILACTRVIFTHNPRTTCRTNISTLNNRCHNMQNICTHFQLQVSQHAGFLLFLGQHAIRCNFLLSNKLRLILHEKLLSADVTLEGDGCTYMPASCTHITSGVTFIL